MRFPALPLALLAATLFVTACDRKAGSIDKDYPLARLTERVYVIHGPNEMPNEANQAFMNNPGFVLTAKGVVVVDPGSSVQVGEMVLKKIATVTQDPVIAVFNTHIHGDHWLGNDAIRRAFPKAVIYAHPNMMAKAAVEGENWIERMNQLSDGAVRGTQVVVPQMGLDNDETLRLGGLHFRLHHTGVAHTDGDLMIEVMEEKLLFLGDNVVAERAGRLDDGNFAGNIAACDAALKTGATVFVPGHGKSGGREVVTAYRGWLTTLYGSVKKHHAAGVDALGMKDKVVPELAAYRTWALFDSEIGKLVSLATLQAEQEAF